MPHHTNVDLLLDLFIPSLVQAASWLLYNEYRNSSFGKVHPQMSKGDKEFILGENPSHLSPKLAGQYDLSYIYIYKYIAQGHFGKSSFTTGILRVIMLVWSSAREASELLVQIHRI